MGKHRNDVAGRKPGDGKPGYKNIDPKHKWLKGGPSPNPEGRRRKPPPSLREEILHDLEALLRSRIPAGNGEHLKVHEALLRRVVIESVNDAKLGMKVLPLLVNLLSILQPDASNDADAVSADDADLIQETLQRLARAEGVDHE